MNYFEFRVVKLGNIIRLLMLLMAMAGAASVHAAPMVTAAKLFAGKDGIYSFDILLSSKVQYNAFLLSDPNRVVIDLEGIKASPVLKGLTGRTFSPESKIVRIRTGHPEAGVTRIVFDLDYLPPNVDAHIQAAGRGKQRLVVTWSQVGESPKMAEAAPPEPEVIAAQPAQQKADPTEAEYARRDFNALMAAQTGQDAGAKAPAAPQGADANAAVVQPELKTASNDSKADSGAKTAAGKSEVHKGWYALAEVGKVIKDSTQSNMDSVATALGDTVTSSSVSRPTTYNLDGGYQLTKNLAVEGGYIGAANENYVANTTNGTAATSQYSGWAAKAVGLYPAGDLYSAAWLNNLDLLGKVGLSRITTKYQMLSALGGATDSTTKNALTFGVGLKYKLTPSVAFRFDVDNYGVATGANSSHMTVWTTGLSYDIK